MACIMACLLGVIAPRTLSVSVSMLGILGTLACAVHMRMKTGQWHISHSVPALVFGGGILMLALISATWAINPASVVERTVKMIPPVLGSAMLFGLATRLDRPALRSLWRTLPVLWIGLSLFLLIDFSSGFPIYKTLRGMDLHELIPAYELNRATMTLSVLALPAMAVMFDALKTTLTGKVKAPCLLSGVLTAGAGLPFAFVLMTQTASQSAQIGFVCGVLILCLWPGQWRSAWRMAQAGLIALLLSFPFVVPPLFASLPQVAYEAGERGRAWHNRANVMPRLEVWDYISRYALQRPLTGFGIEATRNVASFDTKEIYQPGRTNLHPHNAILQIWIEFGLIGIALAIATGLWLLRRLQSEPGIFSQRLSLALVASMGLIAMVGYGLWQGWWLGLIGLAAALTRMILYARTA